MRKNRKIFKEDCSTMLDMLIKNGTIIDGTGKPSFPGSVGVMGDKIVMAKGDEEAKTVIDATGRIICPGFIDAHSHGDLILGRDFARLAKTSQGVTTEMTGQCGLSMAPINPKTMKLIQGMLMIGAPDFPDDEMIGWTDYKYYIDYCERQQKSANIKFLVGHSTLRVAVMGFDNRDSTDEELEKMKELLCNAMENGAGGSIHRPCLHSELLCQHERNSRTGEGHSPVRRHILFAHARRIGEHSKGC